MKRVREFEEAVEESLDVGLVRRVWTLTYLPMGQLHLQDKPTELCDDEKAIEKIL